MGAEIPKEDWTWCSYAWQFPYFSCFAHSSFMNLSEILVDTTTDIGFTLC